MTETKQMKSLNGYEIVDEAARNHIATLEQQGGGTQLYKHTLRYDCSEKIISINEWYANDTMTLIPIGSINNIYFWANDTYFTGLKTYNKASGVSNDTWLAYKDENEEYVDVYSFVNNTWVEDGFRYLMIEYYEDEISDTFLEFLQTNGTLEAMWGTLFKEFTIISTQAEPYPTIFEAVNDHNNIDFVSLMKFADANAIIDGCPAADKEYVFGAIYYLTNYMITMYDREGTEYNIMDFITFGDEPDVPEPYTPIPL